MRNYTNSHIINETQANSLIGKIIEAGQQEIVNLLHIDTNSTTLVALYKIVEDGAEIFLDIETHNYIKLAGDIVLDIKEL